MRKTIILGISGVVPGWRAVYNTEPDKGSRPSLEEFPPYIEPLVCWALIEVVQDSYESRPSPREKTKFHRDVEGMVWFDDTGVILVKDMGGFLDYLKPGEPDTKACDMAVNAWKEEARYELHQAVKTALGVPRGTSMLGERMEEYLETAEGRDLKEKLNKEFLIC